MYSPEYRSLLTTFKYISVITLLLGILNDPDVLFV
jgi:hypothetical protein